MRGQPVRIRPQRRQTASSVSEGTAGTSSPSAEQTATDASISAPPSTSDTPNAPTTTTVASAMPVFRRGLLNSRAPQESTNSSSTGAGDTDSPSGTSSTDTSSPSSDTNTSQTSPSTTPPPSSTTPPPSSTTTQNPPPTSDSTLTTQSSLPSQPPSSPESPPPSASNTSNPNLPSNTNSDSVSQSSGPSPGVQVTTITSSIVTTIGGQRTTISTVFPTSLNVPGPSDSNSKNRTGVIVGSAVAATVVVLAVIGGLFLFYRRRRAQRRGYGHRALPMTRSSLIADDDDFDLAGGPKAALPRLLPPRGAETGSLFHEEVWPPPSSRSRLEDPLLAGSNVDLHSIVDDVMGPNAPEHTRWSTSDTATSTVPLLATAIAPSAFSGKQRRRTPSSGPSEITPLNPAGHSRQLSSESTGSPSRSNFGARPPGAAAPVVRGQSISSTGSPRFTLPTLPTIGSLMVVNRSPTEEENSMPLVDLTPTPRMDDQLKEIPPLYHMIRRDTEQTAGTSAASGTMQSQYSQSSAAEDQQAESKRIIRDSEIVEEPLSATSTIGRAI